MHTANANRRRLERRILEAIAADAEQVLRREIHDFHLSRFGVGRVGTITFTPDHRSDDCLLPEPPLICAAAPVLGLGLHPRQRLEILADEHHDNGGYEGVAIYAVLWTCAGDDPGEPTGQRVERLADLSGLLLAVAPS